MKSDRRGPHLTSELALIQNTTIPVGYRRLNAFNQPFTGSLLTVVCNKQKQARSAFLVWTGLSLALRRLRATLARRASTSRPAPRAETAFRADRAETQGSANATT